jgi:hypothetical protein
MSLRLLSHTTVGKHVLGSETELFRGRVLGFEGEQLARVCEFARTRSFSDFR